jgi:predicted metal-dependent HD superfamily phosphohydrolase
VNHAGDITNSNLKQAGVLGQADIAACLFNLRELMLATVNDNVAAVSRNHKGAVTLDQAATYLCQLSSLHRHHHWYYHEVSHIKGLVNAMADFLLRCFDLTEAELLTYFNTHFPQDMPWH